MIPKMFKNNARNEIMVEMILSYKVASYDHSKIRQEDSEVIEDVEDLRWRAKHDGIRKIDIRDYEFDDLPNHMIYESIAQNFDVIHQEIEAGKEKLRQKSGTQIIDVDMDKVEGLDTIDIELEELERVTKCWEKVAPTFMESMINNAEKENGATFWEMIPALDELEKIFTLDENEKEEAMASLNAILKEKTVDMFIESSMANEETEYAEDDEEAGLN